MVRPPTRVTGLGEARELVAAARELPALLAIGPVDREGHVLVDQLEAAEGVRPVERGEVALEEAHAAASNPSSASRSTPSSAKMRSLKKLAMRSRSTRPAGRYQSQMLL